MQAQQHNYQGRNRSYSMSHADNISSFYHQLQQQQQKPQPQQQAAFPQPLPHHQPAAMMTDSFLQEGSPLSMSSSCGSDDVAYSSDYAPQLQSMGTTTHQQNGFEQHPPAHLQRRASLSSTPVSGGVGASLGILGGFVGEGLRAEYASRRPGGRRKSICLSPSQQQDEQMNVADHYQAQPYTSVPDSEAAESAMDTMAALRRNSLPAANARRNSLSCPLVHNYTPLTAVPTLGRALAEGNLGQRKSIQSFLSMLAQSSNDRSDKRRKRKSSRKDRGKRYKRSDYDESSDDEDDDSSEEGNNNHATAGNGQNPFASPGEHEPSGTAFSGFDYSSGALAAEGSVSSDSSSDTIPSSAGDQSTPSPFEPITPMGSAELFPPYSAGADAASSSTHGGMGTTRPRSRSSPPSYVDSAQVPLTHQQQLQRQYHIAQTNKRLQELRQQHLERLQLQMEMERQQAQQQRHSYEYASTTQRYAAQPFQAQQSGYPPQAHVLGLEMSHQARMTGPQLVHHQPSTSASLPSVLPSHDLGPYHQYGPEIMHHHQQQPDPLAQELMDPQARADFDFYNEFSDFNMCEPASMESLCRTVPEDGLVVAHQAPGTSIPIGSDQLSTDDGPVSEILVDEFSVVPSSAFAHESWLGAGGASEAAPDANSYPSGLAERKDQQTDDSFSEFFNLDDAGMGASH